MTCVLVTHPKKKHKKGWGVAHCGVVEEAAAVTRK
jgi:hypothetical protein